MKYFEVKVDSDSVIIFKKRFKDIKLKDLDDIHRELKNKLL